MHSTLPVPSKGALRALRNLALGTTCTVAFTTGILTEDRRRRIESVQTVRDNARKLKSSRHYHGSGAAEVIEERMLRNRNDSFWESNGPISKGTPTADATRRSTIGHVDKLLWQASTQPSPVRLEGRPNYKQDNVHVGFPISSRPVISSGQKLSESYRQLCSLQSDPELLTTTTDSLSKHNRKSESSGLSAAASRQPKLAFDILNILADTTEPASEGAAVSRFLEAFEDGLVVDDSGISQELMNVAAQLSTTSIAKQNFDVAEQILQIVLSHGKIDFEVFLSFDPESIMKGLILEQPNQDSTSTVLYKAKLKKACSLYLTNFITQPTAVPKSIISLGKELCERACRYELFDLVEGLYWRIESYSDEAPLSLVKHLINAAHKLKQHAKVVKYFRRFYTQTSPSQQEFYTVLGLVMESIFDSNRYRVSEDILLSATRMAQREGLSMSTTWFLKVLGHNWRNQRDIVRTKALFDRLQPYLQLTAHPQAAYGAIIQFCVEANDVPAAAIYYESLTEFHSLSAADVRIYGHFALAKAMRQDWNGVNESLNSMKQMNPDLEEFSSSFTPIFRLFAKTHNVHETEEFLLTFVHKHSGRLTPHMSRILINGYIKAGEFDSVSRWLHYMASANCQVDSSFFSILLQEFYYKFKLSYEEVYQVYQSLVKLDSGASRFINSNTLSTLCEIAISSSSKNVAKGVRRLQSLKLHVPIKHINCGREIREAMVVALANGVPDKALKIYRRALDNRVLLSESTVTLAIKASLQAHPANMDATLGLLQESEQNGQCAKHALSTIFIHLISKLNKDINTSNDSVTDMAQHAISTLDKRGMSIPAYVIAHTMRILVKQWQYQEAVDFWNAVSGREDHQPIPVNLYILTPLLRAYIGLRNPTGVEWVVRTLRINHITPDRQFQQTLVKGRREAEKLIAPYFAHCLVNAVHTVNELRAEATREKKTAMMKIFNIMETALSAEKAEQPETYGPIKTRAEKLKTDSEDNVADPTAAWTYPTDTPVHKMNTASHAILVGVAIG